MSTRRGKGRQFEKGQVAWNRGRQDLGDRLTDEGRQTIAESSSNRWNDEDWATQQREALKGKPGQKTRGIKAGTGVTWKTGKPSWNIKPRILKTCAGIDCANLMSNPPSLARIRFCSQRCQALTTNRTRPDRDHTDVGDQYGSDWPQVRDRILKRDHRQCQLAHRHGNRPAGKRLEVHHLCHDATCRDETHLVTLCSRCHQGGHRRMAWPLELSPTAS